MLGFVLSFGYNLITIQEVRLVAECALEPEYCSYYNGPLCSHKDNINSSFYLSGYVGYVMP